MNPKGKEHLGGAGVIAAAAAVGLLLVLVAGRRSEQRASALAAVEREPSTAEAKDIKRLAKPAGPSALHRADDAVRRVLLPPVGSVRANDWSAGKVRVAPGRVLATVNGVAITLQDLMPVPVGDAGTERVLSAERYGFLLDRAIEREVVFQRAREEHLELSASQHTLLEQLRAASENIEAGVFDTVQQNPGNADFAVRDAAALLLEAVLAEEGGVPSPHVTVAQVQAHYEQHNAEYGLLPVDPAQRAAAWADIDRAIRKKLATQVQEEHRARFEAFREQLKTGATVVIPTT